MSAMRNTAVSFTEKSRLFDVEAAFNDKIMEFNIADPEGNLWLSSGTYKSLTSIS